MENEKSLLQCGGLAGILAFIVRIVEMPLYGSVDPFTPEGLMRFSDVRAALGLSTILMMTIAILSVALFLALYRALRKTSLAPALFGSVLGILGLSAMVVSTTPHAAHAQLSDLYHAPGATPVDQTTLALLWQATWGIFDSMLYVGFFVVPLGLIVLGLGMLGTPAFGKVLGGVTVVLGVVGLVAAALQLVDPSSTIGMGSFLACLISYLILGWKVYSLSRAA